MNSIKFLGALPILLLFQFQLNLYAQDNIALKDGIYLSWEEFKNNKPSIEATKITFVDAASSQKYSCAPFLRYVENEVERHIRSSAVWGLSIHGKSYVRIIADDWAPWTDKNCFFPLFGVQALSKFFVVEGDLALQNVVRRKSPPTFREYVLDFGSGRVYNLKKELKEIVGIIKTDSLLANEKIKRNNIHLYIEKYNRNNLPNPIDTLAK